LCEFSNSTRCAAAGILPLLVTGLSLRRRLHPVNVIGPLFQNPLIVRISMAGDIYLRFNWERPNLDLARNTIQRMFDRRW
jgi:hypothetical protein